MLSGGVNVNEIRIIGGSFRDFEYLLTLFGVADKGWIWFLRLDGDGLFGRFGLRLEALLVLLLSLGELCNAGVLHALVKPGPAGLGMVLFLGCLVHAPAVKTPLRAVV